MKLKKGDRVHDYLTTPGCTTKTVETVARVTKGLVYLDNGPGNDESGPFDLKTGYATGDLALYGFGVRRIKKLKSLK